MDGFRDRLSGRYERGNDRSSSRSDRYDRGSSEDRYDRSPRRESVNIDAINSAIDNSNRDQLEIIADMFDEAKADRLESEKAIIDEISSKIEKSLTNISSASEKVTETKAEPEVKEPIVVASADAEALSRIERMSSQNAESLSENSDMLERSISSLRSNAEILNEIKGSVEAICSAQEEIKNANQMIQQEVRDGLSQASMSATPSYDPYASNEDTTKEEILSALGDNRSMLSMIRQDIITGFSNASQNNEEEDASEKIIPLSKAEGQDIYQKLEEQIHKECVKCFRNVENTLKDQNAESKVEKSIAGVHTLGVVSIALNVVTIVLIVCRVLGIL